MAKPAQPKPKPPAPPVPEPIAVVERPDFIPEGASITTVLTTCDDLRRAARVEAAIKCRCGIHDAELYERRIKAIMKMAAEGMRYARYLRQIERQPSARFAGYGIGDRVLVTDTGGMEGEVIGFSPLFEPTHILVWLDSGKQCPYVPDRLMPAKELK